MAASRPWFSLPPLINLVMVFLCVIFLFASLAESYQSYGTVAKERRISLSGRKQRVPAREHRLPSRGASLTGQRGQSYSRYASNRLSSSSSSSSPYSSASLSSSSSSQSSSSSSSQRSSGSRYPGYRQSSGKSSHRGSSGRRHSPRSSQPNIVVIMTDDQDVLLGSLNYMPKVQNLLIRPGAYFNNSFVPTPMCCPSRSTFLTGMYVHNHNVYTNNENCSSTQWQKHYESRNFATYINETYTTGYFGKYLNEYDGGHTPPGWSRWVGLVKNSRFYNYTVVNEWGQKTKHGDNYYMDYLTDLVANDSVSFLHYSKKRFPSKPLMMVLSVPAPHGPEDAAPQYQHMFVNNTAHRTQAWNYAPNPDKQWLLQNIYPMMPQYKLFTDLLQRRRLQTLQSVDDLVEKVVGTLDLLGELDNTYILYTSDHGYHLGQFGLIKGKAMPFDFDTRVPLIVRGPGIRPGTVISNIVSNVDIAPTILDIAGKKVPDHMDGQSVLKLIKGAKDPKNVDQRGFVSLKRPWRDTILFERGKLSEKIMKQRMRTEEMSIFNQMGNKRNLHFYIPPRTRKLAMECSKGENRLPCKPFQKWYCIEDNGRLRRHKCRNKGSINTSGDGVMQRDEASEGEPCSCSRAKRMRRLGRIERKRQRRFLKKQIGRDYRPNNFRFKRSTGIAVNTSSTSGGFNGFDAMFNRRCRILANQSVLCDLDIYRKASEWESHKERIDDMIKEYRKALEDLRDIRRHLRKQRPLDAEDDDMSDEEDEKNWNDDSEEDCDCDEQETDLTPQQRRRMKDRESRIEARLKRRKMRRQRRKRKNDNCNNENMNCFTHNNDHWKTPPYWHYGPFCFCSNANNNTFWCLRTINQTHDFVYCEFITTFMSYYDLLTDPFQLKNTVTELNYGVIQQLHEALKKLKHCSGSKDCTMSSNQKNQLPHEPDWPGLRNLRQSSRNTQYEDEDKTYKDDLYSLGRKSFETKFSSDLDYE
ncbi:extracellular sulfatase Sulf-2 [Aplysia californica]|uniref:Extracellular sulfatase Sulf-2 n=1 Tax=Aplysia californica TaxID=6500 RepID=A0ABM1VRX3_APLCA|nr:extracellular sulfatase Sulf-2 [Aplysia californica]